MDRRRERDISKKKEWDGIRMDQNNYFFLKFILGSTYLINMSLISSGGLLKFAGGGVKAP